MPSVKGKIYLYRATWYFMDRVYSYIKIKGTSDCWDLMQSMLCRRKFNLSWSQNSPQARPNEMRFAHDENCRGKTKRKNSADSIFFFLVTKRTSARKLEIRSEKAIFLIRSVLHIQFLIFETAESVYSVRKEFTVSYWTWDSSQCSEIVLFVMSTVFVSLLITEKRLFTQRKRFCPNILESLISCVVYPVEAFFFVQNLDAVQYALIV